MTLSQKRQTLVGLGFMAPWIVGFLLLVVYPFAMSLYWSFCDYDLLSAPTFVGGKHYSRLAEELAAGEGFGRVLWNTAYYAGISVPLSIALGLSLAVVLSWRVRGQAIWRTLVFLPSVVPVVAMAILWRWLLDPQAGPVNALVSLTGLPQPGWFHDYREAAWLPGWFTGDAGFGSKDALILMSLWGVGNFMVIYLAALGDVPQRLHEAAALDGAGRLARFRHVTLPILSPVIFFNLTMGLIQAVQTFTQIYIVSEGTGEPERSTLMLSLHLFLSAFQDLNMGYASAMAWMLFLVLSGITVLLFRSARWWVYYEGQS